MTLAAQMTADLDAFFDVSGFAVAASLVMGGGSPVDVAVIFDSPYLESDPAAGVGVESTQPTARIKTADAAGIVHGDTLTIGATVYTVTGVQPDGNGVTLLNLRV